MFRYLRGVNGVSRLRRHNLRVLCSSESSYKLPKTILDHLPTSSITESLWPNLKEFVNTIDPKRVIVLDDDPTGCQTVYDCNVLIDHSVDSIKKQLLLDEKLFYILTNTRSMDENGAKRILSTVLSNIQEAVEQLSYIHPIQYISRSGILIILILKI